MHDTSAAHPFDALTPDVVLDALDSVGLRGDGRLTALSSYENRVYQVPLEDGGVVVAKFYRPHRWSDAQILEEHAFAAELMAAEVPAIGPLLLQGTTLNHFGGFSFSVSPRRGGRAPALHREANQPPPVLLHMRSGPEGGVKRRPLPRLSQPMKAARDVARARAAGGKRP